MPFDGTTYDPKNDKTRLTAQFSVVKDFMLRLSYASWYTLGELSAELHYSEASISARLRDLRKPKFGAYTVERRHRLTAERGLYEYRVVRPA